MKNKDNWRPSKFVRRQGRLMGSRDTNELGISSRLSADLVARWYDINIRQYARGRLLDLGCGKVPLFEAYRDFVSDNICVDWGNSLHNNTHLDLECDLTQQLPFADGEFDTIILSDVLEHIPEPGQLWREMSRVLSADGRILLNVPFFYWLHEQPHDFYRYTEHALERFANSVQMRITHLSAVGGAPEIVTDILAKNMASLPWIGKPLAVVAQVVTGAFVNSRIGGRISAASARRFPMGYALVAQKHTEAGSPAGRGRHQEASSS